MKCDSGRRIANFFVLWLQNIWDFAKNYKNCLKRFQNMVDSYDGYVVYDWCKKRLRLNMHTYIYGLLIGWLCFTSHRQRGYLEMAPPFTVPCERREARFLNRTHREFNPGPSRGSPLHNRCAVPAQHTYIHKCIHTYIHTCIHTNIHTYMHTYIYIHKHTYIHVYIHTCIHTCIHTYMKYLKQWESVLQPLIFRMIIFIKTLLLHNHILMTYHDWQISINVIYYVHISVISFASRDREKKQRQKSRKFLKSTKMTCTLCRTRVEIGMNNHQIIALLCAHVLASSQIFIPF